MIGTIIQSTGTLCSAMKRIVGQNGWNTVRPSSRLRRLNVVSAAVVV
jgi:hypothetical protein